MIDSIIVPSWVHASFGGMVLLSTFAAMIWSGLRAIARKPFSWIGHALFIISQISLMIQALIGIKLLDQGLGVLQLYIHYVGGLAPLAFFLVYYWLPERVRAGRWTTTLVSGAGFLFAVMAFFIGQSYVASGSGFGG